MIYSVQFDIIILNLN